MNGRSRVWTALKKGGVDRPPKGEILVEADWLRNCGLPDLGAAVEYLNADLVVLPLAPKLSSATNWQEWAKSNIFLFGQLQGPVTFFSERQGWPAFSRLIIKQPGEAVQLITQFIGDAVQVALRALDKGCDGIVVFDDLAGDRGLFVNPKFLTAVYFPIVQSALEQLTSKAVPVIFHSDGNILSLIPILKAAGFWGIQGLQPSVGLGPEAFSEQAMKDWVFWGNFEFEGQGRLKNTGEVQQEVVQLLSAWADFPGFIFGSSGGIYKGLDLPEIKVAYDMVDNWRRSAKLASI